MSAARRVVVGAMACSLAVTALAACSLLAGLDGLAGGGSDAAGPPSGDAGGGTDAGAPPNGTLDASSEAGSGDAAGAADGASNSDLLFDDFESLPTCSGWDPSYGTATISDVGYKSAHSCIICKTGDIYVDKSVANPTDGTVGLELWAQRANSAPIGTRAYAHLIFRTATETQQETAQLPLNDTWTRLEVRATPTVLTAKVLIRLRVEEGCFRVDAIRLYAVP